MTTHASTDSLPQWSPDGQWVAFGSLRPGPGVWRIPAEGGAEEQLADNAFLVLDWSPDGQTLYIAGLDALSEVSADGSRQRRLMDPTGRSGTLPVPGSAASDGRYLYFAWMVNEGDIWVMDVVQDEQ